MKKIKNITAMLLLFMVFFAVAGVQTFAAGEPEIGAKAAILIDTHTKSVLYEKNMHERLPIASMTKIMTLCLIFDAVEAGTLKLDDGILISEHAKAIGGSHVFTELNEYYKAQDMIKSIIIASANDACIAMAEHLAGSEEGFVQKMNAKAQALGMKDTTFVNCTGMPVDGHVSSAYDVALMSTELLGHSDYFKWSSIWMDQLVHKGGRITELTNTNRLVRFFDGCDGVKTGYTSEAKFCVSTTVKRGNMRLVSVIIGGETSQKRFDAARDLINYGFANYGLCEPVPRELELAPIPMEKSLSKYAEVKIDGHYAAIVPKGEESSVEAVFDLPETLTAPLAEGQEIGRIIIRKNGEELYSIPVVTANEYKEITIGDIVGKLIERW